MLGSAPRIAAGLSVLVASLAISGPAHAIEPGFDLFETDPERTVFTFSDEFTIPAGFFDPQSAPFSGRVHFGGDPLKRFQRQRVGDADTAVRRLEAADVEGDSTTDTLPIEVAQLSLQAMAPIEVQVGTSTQLWDVRADLSRARPSPGAMTLTRTSPEGGSFESELRVFPRFTFTRVAAVTRVVDREVSGSQTQTRVIDVGAMQLSPQSEEKLTFRARGVPWRRGCRPPALLIPAINGDFCASFDIEDNKVLTEEEAVQASHAILPVQPLLEHFECYSARQTSAFDARVVDLRDQFGEQRVGLRRPNQLCNPVSKNAEGIVNDQAHLQCRPLSQRPAVGQNVLVRNQFGFDAMRVLRPQALCLPSRKGPVGSQILSLARQRQFLIDHYRCFSVEQSRFRRRRVRLRDQFLNGRALLIETVRLCAPARKNRTEIRHPVRHLVCYRLRQRVPSGRLPRAVDVVDQFGRETLVARTPRTLCVPSLKIRTP